MEYTEDVVDEAWLDAKSYITTCEEQIRYRLEDTFLPGTYASAATMPPAHCEDHTLFKGNPDLTTPHHMITPHTSLGKKTSSSRRTRK